MLSKLNLILLLQLNIIFDELSWSLLLSLFVFLAKLNLISEGHLHDFRVGYEFFIVVEIDFLEIGAIFMGGGYVGPYFVEARSSNEGFDFIQQFLDLHIAREARVDFDGRF